MREELTRERLLEVVRELSRAAPRRRTYRLFLVGGGTAVYLGWRRASIDVDFFSEQDALFVNVQQIKERLNVNVELARPEDFVPPLAGSEDRHVFIERVGPISLYHYDPYAQLLSKVVRGFQRDIDDASEFIKSGLVDGERFRSLVRDISDSAYAKYPRLSRRGVENAVDAFLSDMGRASRR